MKPPTIDLFELAALARKAFGAEFVRLSTKPYVRRYEEITIYTLSAKARPNKYGYSHRMTFSNDNKPDDPDRVRAWLREFLTGIIDDARKKQAAEALR